MRSPEELEFAPGVRGAKSFIIEVIDLPSKIGLKMQKPPVPAIAPEVFCVYMACRLITEFLNS